MDENNFYDEIMNEKDLKEKKSIGPFFIILLIIIILGFGVYVTYLKLTDKKEEKEEEIIKPVEEIQTIELTCDEACDYKVLIDNEEVPISYTVSKSIDDEYTHKVTIHNNTVIDKTFSCGGPAILKVLKDTILISYHDGCDIGGNTLHAYNKDGLELFSYEYLDPILNMWMENTDFEVEDNKVKNVQFVGGCSGNTQGVARLIDGMDIDEAISRIEGIQCGFRPTSCPDQLAQALKEYKANVK